MNVVKNSFSLFRLKFIPTQYPRRLSGVEQGFPAGADVGGGLVVCGIPSLQHIKGFLPTFLFPQFFWFASRILTVPCDGFDRYKLINVAHIGSSMQTPAKLSCVEQLSPVREQTKIIFKFNWTNVTVCFCKRDFNGCVTNEPAMRREN